MKRHAYLIAAHKNQKQLKILLSLLDIEQNDIYLHIDIKSKDIVLEELRDVVKKARLFFTERTSVMWADYTIVNSTLVMLKEATGREHYSYYHLLSGQDLPLKPIEEINRFYDENDQANNYVDYDKTGNSTNSVLGYRIDQYKKRVWILSKIIRRLKRCFVKYTCGAAWFDINDDLARLVIKKEKWIKKHFQYFQLPDEAFLQTIMNQYGFMGSRQDYMRYIDWENSPDAKSPYVFQEKDFDRLISSGMNFARKFDMQQDERIVLKIQDYIMNKSGLA